MVQPQAFLQPQALGSELILLVERVRLEHCSLSIGAECLTLYWELSMERGKLGIPWPVKLVSPQVRSQDNPQAMSAMEEICRAWGLMEGVVILTQGFSQVPKEEILKWRREEMSWYWPGEVEWGQQRRMLMART